MSQSLLDLDLDLDAFCGPFDLLLALVLRRELDLVEVPLAAVVVAYLERLAARDEVDLESLSEFVVLIASLCELKVRLLLDGDEEDEIDVEEAAAELAERLTEYRRFKEAAAWLADRRLQLGRRVFRAGAPALPVPRREVDLPPEQPDRLALAIGRLLTLPEQLDTTAVRGRSVPVRPFIERFRKLLSARGTFLFDEQVLGLERAEQAAAFLALLELYKRGELRFAQRELFAPIRVARSVGITMHDAAEQTEAVA